MTMMTPYGVIGWEELILQTFVLGTSPRVWAGLRIDQASEVLYMYMRVV